MCELRPDAGPNTRVQLQLFGRNYMTSSWLSFKGPTRCSYLASVRITEDRIRLACCSASQHLCQNAIVTPYVGLDGFEGVLMQVRWKV